MTIDERLGLKNPEFNERYEKLIELIGLDAIIPYVPATKEEVKEAVKISKSLNLILLSKYWLNPLVHLLYFLLTYEFHQ